MKTLTKRIFALAGILALGLTAVKAQEDALLNALVKKGVLSDKEAEEVRADAAKEYAQTPASKLSLSNSVTKLNLYGDARLRYEYLDETPQLQNGGAAGAQSNYSHDNIVERYRYRLRIGADYTLTDNFKAGVELESATAADSANQSFGNGFGKASINIGLVYLQYHPTDWLTLTGGKQRNPLYSTDLEWDPDINPEGGSETLSWTFPIGDDSSVPVTSHDPKDIVSMKAVPSDMSLTIGLTAAQFIYADNNEYNTPQSNISGTGTVVTPGSAQAGNIAAGNADHTDVWMFVEQIPVQFNFDKNTYIKEVPGFTSYLSGGNTGISSSFVNGSNGDTGWTDGGAFNFTGPNIADHLEIFTAPGEFDWKSWDVPFRIYWDFALNTDGKARVQDVYLGNGNPNITGGSTGLAQAQNRDLGDNIAWLAGLQVGQNKKKGDWSIKGDFRQVGLGSIDPNTNDSDWGDSFLNQQGIKIQSTYNFTDFLTGSITYYDTWNYKEHLMDGGTTGQIPTGLPLAGGTGYSVGSATTNPSGTTTDLNNLVGANTTQRVQVDLQWKF